ncbi:TetR family transcriptional regulator, partial [Rhizobium leguminosarum]
MRQENNATPKKRGRQPRASAQRRALEAAHEILLT